MESKGELSASVQLSVEVFFCYAQEDERFRCKLERYLRPLQRARLISSWHKHCIVAGTDWVRDTEEHLESASVILLLVSVDFLASDYCYCWEMERALQRHQDKDARVIPVLLRPVDWKSTPFRHLQVLPSNARPISIWRNSDQAYADVASGIHLAIKDLACISANYSNIMDKIYSDTEAVPQIENASSRKSWADLRVCEFSKDCLSYRPMRNA